MRLDMLMLADAAAGPPDGKLYIHGGGISRITAPVLPWTQPQMAIVARFLVEEDDEDETNELAVTFRNPAGQDVLPPAVIDISSEGVAPPAFEGEERFLQLMLNVAAVTFTLAGLYRLEMTLNGELARSLTLAVVGQQGGATPPGPNRAGRRAQGLPPRPE